MAGTKYCILVMPVNKIFLLKKKNQIPSVVKIVNSTKKKSNKFEQFGL
jgi:hypothetical protein